MNYCKQCGNEIVRQDGICDSCEKNKSGSTNPIEEMNLLGETSDNSNPFSKMDEARSFQTPDNDSDFANNAPLQEEDFAEKQAAQIAAEREYLRNYHSLSKNYGLGFAGAIIGAIVGTIPWIIASCAGWFVAWLGYLIAIAAAKGYDLLKVRPSKFKFWGIIIGVVIGVFFSQIASDIISILMDPEFKAYDQSFLISIYFDNFSEIMSENAGNLVLGYVFAGLGSYNALKNIKEEMNLIEELKVKHPGECFDEN